MVTFALLLAAFAAGKAPTSPAEEHHDATIHHSFDDVAKWVAVFDDPERDAWQKPEQVLHAIGVTEGMTVADLGAGTGDFSVRPPKAVRDKRKGLANHGEPKLLHYMKKRAP